MLFIGKNAETVAPDLAWPPLEALCRLGRHLFWVKEKSIFLTEYKSNQSDHLKATSSNGIVLLNGESCSLLPTNPTMTGASRGLRGQRRGLWGKPLLGRPMAMYTLVTLVARAGIDRVRTGSQDSGTRRRRRTEKSGSRRDHQDQAGSTRLNNTAVLLNTVLNYVLLFLYSCSGSTSFSLAGLATPYSLFLCHRADTD